VSVSAPPLPPDLEDLLRRLRLPHIRRHAPEVVATAKAQRWEPAEVLKALFAEEVAGRERSALATRGPPPGSPPGRPSTPGSPSASSIPAPTQQALRTLEWVTGGRTSWCAGRRGPGRRSCSKPSASTPSSKASRSPGSPWKTSASCCAGTAPTTPSPRPSPGSCEPTSSSSMTSGCCPVAADAAEGLYRLVDAAYEKRSIAISSNLHPSGFDELMPKTLATATVDRLLHHAHVCQTSGDSVRLTQALAGQGVSPLT
jgi:hypothetical protein